MAFTEEKFARQLTIAKLKLEEITELSQSECTADITMAYEQVGELLKRLEHSRDQTTEYLLDKESELEYVKQWTTTQKASMQPIRESRQHIKKLVDDATERETQGKLEKELHIQQRVSEEQSKHRLRQQQEIEEIIIRQQKQEEEWYLRKLDYEKQIQARHAEQVSSGQSLTAPSTQAVKLQKYTITPFSGDYKDWLRFWNQFTVEVDGSNIAEVSKFNYLIELVKDKPREDILGLPHTAAGYQEAKKILLQTYGKDIKVHKSLIKGLEEIPTVTNIHKLNEVHDFYNRLSRIVRTLKTMNKLTTAQSSVYTLMDKLGPVREVLVQKDDNWEEWGLEELVESLRKYVERNPQRVTEENNTTKWRDDKKRKDEKLLLGSNGDHTSNRKIKCVYCRSEDHSSYSCVKVLDLATGRAILRRNRMCFNCTGVGHFAIDCRSRGCRNCKGKHHTSICDRAKSTLNVSESAKVEKGLSITTQHTSAIHATVLSKVGTETVRIMFDTGAGSSYVCTDLITQLHLKPIKREQRCIEQMYGTVRKTVELYTITIESLAVGGFSFDVTCVNAEKGVLTHLPNPNIKSLKKRHVRFRRLQFSEEETTENLLAIHIILGAADYQRIRTTEPLVLGINPDKDPGAEFTMLGWTISGKQSSTESQTEKQFFMKTGYEEFEKLCSLDVLGIRDVGSKVTSMIHEEFRQQLSMTEQGYYETKLLWKEDHIPLPTNKGLCTARLYSTSKKLERMGKLEEYNDIMREQINERIIEPAPFHQTGEVIHYVPHQAVIREKAETTKMRIVYDCSAKANTKSPSLNDCLETGPSLQPLLFDIMIRNRMRKYCIRGDIQKAFLQIRVHEQDRDAMRILWYNNLQDRQLMEYRFTRVIFGATSSPYILGVTLQKHIENYRENYPITVQTLLDDTYVDDIQGGETERDVAVFKEESTKILSEGGFSLHKWHSNITHLSSKNNIKHEGTDNTSTSDTKILGIPWNKMEDTLILDFEPGLKGSEPTTKRKMISDINSIYDILGWSSPVTITAKLIFSEVCLLQLHWDERVPEGIHKKWWMWIKSLQLAPTITIPRCVFTDTPTSFEIHGFADASKVALCAAVYVVACRDSKPVSQQLLVAKSRIAPKDRSIPRLGLAAAHTLAKLQNNVSKALAAFPITAWNSWVDSTTVLYWLQNHGEWSTFVRNRVRKIGELTDAQWRYVPTTENPSDLGTRGTTPDHLGTLWFNGPKWLSSEIDRPVQPEISESAGTKTEKRSTKYNKAMLLTEDENDLNKWVQDLLSRFPFWKLLRITAHIKRFADSCRGMRRIGPLTKSEMSAAETVWIKMTQQTNRMTVDIAISVDHDGIQRCSSRIQGYNPIYIPQKTALARRIIEHCHILTLHGGVATTMSKVREKYWILKLRSLVKSILHNCNHCKKYRAKMLDAPVTSVLPAFRTEFTEPFDVTGVDFAGPLHYKLGKSETNKSYIAPFTCATTRAVHLKLCRDMSTIEFKRGLKEFVARRGSPSCMVSDNAKTFVATKMWLTKLQNDEDIFNYLTTKGIEWRFNLSCSPWWGGFFERLIGITKRALSKTIGRALLTFEELEEVLLDVEVFMNNRPLCYMEEDLEQVVITPNMLLRGQPARYLEDNVHDLDDDIGKRLKYLKTCREHVRKRWLNEYLHALQERNTKGLETKKHELPGKNSVILLKDSTKYRANWKIGRIVDTIVGKDGVIRGYKIKTGSGYIVERPLQLVCDLEISNTNDETPVGDDIKSEEPVGTLKNQNVSRPSRKAKTAAVNRLVGVIANEIEDD
ncbi:uncharacterized protein LOC100366659 [Saccoglossus kowalevskii]|uniref:Uncharacterized protein LOC100366659 n=1 Tax=Saccoglossus kowalevskii TaxID=10224 RepID=A0ABM0GQ66_SACKO|nr:PREDICTED: uncharacterized protein LOC100366659 [Saccoglossus kowalevskii]